MTGDRPDREVRPVWHGGCTGGSAETGSRSQGGSHALQQAFRSAAGPGRPVRHAPEEGVPRGVQSRLRGVPPRRAPGLRRGARRGPEGGEEGGEESLRANRDISALWGGLPSESSRSVPLHFVEREGPRRKTLV